MNPDHKCKECTCEHNIHIWDECTACFAKSELLKEYMPEGAKEYTDV